ncbi:hypothetical protein pb186bvf_007354 [Paramecium bursaria]
MDYIKYLCILDQKNNIKYIKSVYDGSYIQQITYQYIDIINIQFQLSNLAGHMGILGKLNQDNIYGFMSNTFNKILIIVVPEQEKRKYI